MGNSQLVAVKHYLQITEEHFRAATVRNDAMQNARHGVGADAIASEEYKRDIERK
jgi:hypothetical protein